MADAVPVPEQRPITPEDFFQGVVSQLPSTKPRRAHAIAEVLNSRLVRTNVGAVGKRPGSALTYAGPTLQAAQYLNSTGLTVAAAGLAIAGLIQGFTEPARPAVVRRTAKLNAVLAYPTFEEFRMETPLRQRVKIARRVAGLREVTAGTGLSRQDVLSLIAPEKFGARPVPLVAVAPTPAPYVVPPSPSSGGVAGGSTMPFANTSPLLLGYSTGGGDAGGGGDLLGGVYGLLRGLGVGGRVPGPGGGRGTGRRAYAAPPVAVMPGGGVVNAGYSLNLGGAEGITIGDGCSGMFKTNACGTTSAQNTVTADNPTTGKQEIWKRVIPTGYRLAGKRRHRGCCAPRRRRSPVRRRRACRPR